jgi:4-amino-4-deoxy-L-arabinose transferase-like glycosyltransferase
MAFMRKAALRTAVQATATGVTAFAVYLHTLAPTVMWYDMGEFATAASVLGIAHNTGYPLFILLGKLFTWLPFGDAAYRVNLMSAVFGALTVALTFLIILRLTGSRIGGWVGALTIAFSSTLWSNATWAISYDLNAFLTLLIFLLLARWQDAEHRRDLYAALFIFGLGFGNHRLIVVLALPIIYLVWRGSRQRSGHLSARDLMGLGGVFLLGFSINLYLPIRAMQNPPYMWADATDPATFLRMVTTGAVKSRVFINPFGSSAEFRAWRTVLASYPAYELTAPGLLLAAAGAWALARTRGGTFTITIMVMAVGLIMVSVYGIHNIYNYFQPVYLMAAIWIGVGIPWIAGEVATWLEAHIPGKRAPRLSALSMLLVGLLCLTIPAYLLVRNLGKLDRSKHQDARDFARYVLTTVKTGEIVLADFWSWSPMKYLQLVEGVGEGVAVLPVISDPDLDQEWFVGGLLEAGAPVYVAVSSENSPRLQIPSEQLQLIAPFVIHSFTTPSRPLPEFKDLLVPQGMLYQAVDTPPDLSVEVVPQAEQVEVEFEGGIRLRGFGFGPNPVEIGEPFRARYYWQIDSPVEKEYWVDVLFTDEDGNVATHGGFPIWLHSHWLGGGAFPTDRWIPGQIYREVYDGLVPRDIQPGEYQVRIVLYSGGIRQDVVGAVEPVSSEGGVPIGTVRVIGSGE